MRSYLPALEIAVSVLSAPAATWSATMWMACPPALRRKRQYGWAAVLSFGVGLLAATYGPDSSPLVGSLVFLLSIGGFFVGLLCALGRPGVRN